MQLDTNPVLEEEREEATLKEMNALSIPQYNKWKSKIVFHLSHITAVDRRFYMPGQEFPVLDYLYL